MSDVLVLALGNLLRGDDGVGPAILEALRKSGGLPESVSLLEGNEYRLLTALLASAYRQVIIVDAVDLGRRAGEWSHITIDVNAMNVGQATPQVTASVTAHDANLIEVLAMGKALGLMPPEMVIYGIQPLEIDWSTELSQPVQTAIPEVCEDILKLGRQYTRQNIDCSPDPRPEDNPERSE